jgi:hypothetical protein
MASSANVFGGLVITDSYSRAYANVFSAYSGQGYLGGFDLNQSNNVNNPFTDTRTMTFGDRTYNYTYNASNSYSVIGSQIKLSASAWMSFSGTVPGGGDMFDSVYTTMRFKVDQTYQATVNFDFSRPSMLPPRFEKIDVFNGGVGAAYQAQSINGTVFEFGDKTVSFELPPGEYEFGANYMVNRDGPLDLENYIVSSSTVLTLTPAAVPEPSSLILMGTAGAFGLSKLRRKWQRRTL